MKITISAVANPEFYSKHAGKRTFAVFVRLLFQIVSFGTAFYGAFVWLPIQNPYWHIAVAAGLAGSFELLVFRFGYSALIPTAEHLTGLEAYQIEQEAARADRIINRVSQALFYMPLIGSAILTVLGAFAAGAEIKAAGPEPIYSAVQDSLTAVVADRPQFAADPRRTELKRLQTEITTLSASIAEKDSIYNAAWSTWERTRRSWPSAAFIWLSDGGRDKEADKLTALQSRAATLSDALAEADQVLSRTIKEETDRVHGELLTAWRQRKEKSDRSGSLALLFGVFAQAGVLGLHFFVVMVDVGTGQIIRRTPSRYDRKNLLAERLEIIAERLKARFEYHTAELSSRELLIKRRTRRKRADQVAISVRDDRFFTVFRMPPKGALIDLNDPAILNGAGAKTTPKPAGIGFKLPEAPENQILDFTDLELNSRLETDDQGKV